MSDELSSFAAKLHELVNQITADISNRRTRSLLRHRARVLRERRQSFDGFEQRLYDRWQEALDLFELCLYLAGKCGDVYRKIWMIVDPQGLSKQSVALSRLHGIAMLIAGEVLHLLKGGYASGAHARWRSLHETTVVAMFIARGDEDLAERFVSHRVIKSFEDAQEFQKHAEKLGQEKLSQKELEKLRKAFDAVLLRYGDDFAGSYGWAKHALQTMNPHRKGSVRFSEIEKVVGIDFWVPYYRMASHSVHPTATTINFNIGGLDPALGILSGPSNAGLADPGHGALLSLANETAVLMTRTIELNNLRDERVEERTTNPAPLVETARPSIDIMAMTSTLSELVGLAGEAFIRAHEQLELEERTRKEERDEGK